MQGALDGVCLPLPALGVQQEPGGGGPLGPALSGGWCYGKAGGRNEQEAQSLLTGSLYITINSGLFPKQRLSMAFNMLTQYCTERAAKCHFKGPLPISSLSAFPPHMFSTSSALPPSPQTLSCYKFTFFSPATHALLSRDFPRLCREASTAVTPHVLPVGDTQHREAHGYRSPNTAAAH